MTYYCVLFVDDVLLLWWTDVWSVMRVIYYFCSFRVHQCCLSLLSSFSHVLIGSVLLIVLVCSWLVHQCSLCLLSSPLPSFRWGPCCSSFSLSTCVDCVYWVHPSPVFHGISVAHLFTLFLTCSPMLSVYLDFTPSFFDRVCAAHFLLVLDFFTDIVCVSTICSLKQCWVRLCFVNFFYYGWCPIFECLRVQLVLTIWVAWRMSFASTWVQPRLLSLFF
jgi:hypothetical protein